MRASCYDDGLNSGLQNSGSFLAPFLHALSQYMCKGLCLARLIEGKPVMFLAIRFGHSWDQRRAVNRRLANALGATRMRSDRLETCATDRPL